MCQALGGNQEEEEAKLGSEILVIRRLDRQLSNMRRGGITASISLVPSTGSVAHVRLEWPGSFEIEVLGQGTTQN